MKDRPKHRKCIGDIRGFTLAELLITVGIVVILCALGTIAIFRIQKNLRQKELDSKAEIIYEAAQNQITKLKTAGDLTAYQSTDHGAVVIPAGEIQDYLEESDFLVDGDNGNAQVKDVFCYVKGFDSIYDYEGKTWVDEPHGVHIEGYEESQKNLGKVIHVICDEYGSITMEWVDPLRYRATE